MFAAGQPDYNLYTNSGGFAFMCGNPSSAWYGITAFSSWQSCVSAESHSLANTGTTVPINGDGTLIGGSQAIGIGKNLTSMCSGALVPLCSQISGVARPASGAWNAGAF